MQLIRASLGSSAEVGDRWNGLSIDMDGLTSVPRLQGTRGNGHDASLLTNGDPHKPSMFCQYVLANYGDYQEFQ